MNKGTLVVIYGIPQQDWKDSFYPYSKTWLDIPEVSKVVLYDDYSTLNEKYEKEVIIPLLEPHIIDCPRNMSSLISSPEIIKLLNHKKQFIDFLIDNGFEEYCATQYTQENIQYPAILKPVSNSGGLGIKILLNNEDLNQETSNPDLKNKEYYIEEYIKDPIEYVVNVLCKNGKIIWSFGHKYTRSEEYYVKRGVQGHTSFYDAPQNFMNIFEKIIEKLNFNGPCNFGYKIQDEKPKFFEINPRFGSGLVIPVAHKPYFTECLRKIIENAQ